MINYENLIRRSIFCHFAPLPFDVKIERQNKPYSTIRDKELLMMQIVDKLTMFNLAVSDMPKAKAFYADTLGLKVTKDYRQDDQNWWVTLTTHEGGISINLARYGEQIIKAGT